MATPAYALVCLYRILEGLFNDRDLRGREASARGEASPASLVWFVPQEEKQFIPWMKALYRNSVTWSAVGLQLLFPVEARGRRLTWVKDHHLKPLRDKFAHSIFGDLGDVYCEENVENLTAIDRWLPLGEMMVRRLLKDKFPNEFLVGVPDDGLDDLLKEATTV